MFTAHRTLRTLAALAVIALAVMVLAGPALAEKFLGKHGDWEAFSDKESGKTVCYMASEPLKMQGKYAKRGASYAMVTHRPAEKSRNVVSIRAGYTHKAGSEVEVAVGKDSFKLFTKDGWAYAPDADADNALVKAMVRGSAMLVIGVSERGTKTTDTYSLKGFTAAYGEISKACKG
jgi:invasion protein IalB